MAPSPIAAEELPEIQGPMVEWKAGLTNTKTTVLAQGHRTAYRAITDGAISDTAEKVLARNNLQPISTLQRGIELSRCVAHITIPNVGLATGFLIGPDILLTNHHVFREADEAAVAIVRFNYQNDLQGHPLPTDDYRCQPNKLFWTSEGLDASVVKLSAKAGETWGYCPLPESVSLECDTPVMIIQHPNGGPKKIALTDNEVQYCDERFAQYLTDTLPGSSGSPVFDDLWNLVALHHSGGWIPEPDDHSTHFRNEGIIISAIRAALLADEVNIVG